MTTQPAAWDMTPTRSDAPIDLSHDYLTQRGGAERVVLAMQSAFPNAATHCALYEPDLTFPEFRGRDIRPLVLDRIGPIRRNHRLGLPLTAPAFRSRRVDAAAVLCSTSGWAHGIGCTGPKIVYCHSPARWLYRPDGYLRHFGRSARWGLSAARRLLERWDRAAMATADRILVNSTTIMDEVQHVYGRSSEVVPPTSTLDPAGGQQAVADLAPGFWLTVSRLLGYKRLDVLVETARHRSHEQFVVIGEGPHASALQAGAPGNVRWLGQVDDATLRWAYANSRGLVGTSEEDFGLTPLEAASFGTPSVVPKARGYLDHVVEGASGIFYDGSSNGLVAALDDLHDQKWPAARVTASVAEHQPAVFTRRIVEIVERVL